jgi:hypothetical protein
MILADDGKRDLLTQMLSHRCPEWLDSASSTEFTLVAAGEKRLRDGILVLCDAFDKAKSESNRTAILRILRRAFVGHGIAAPNDRAFVEACRSWYTANKDRLTLNDFYRLSRRDNISPLFIVDDAKPD